MSNSQHHTAAQAIGFLAIEISSAVDSSEELKDYDGGESIDPLEVALTALCGDCVKRLSPAASGAFAGSLDGFFRTGSRRLLIAFAKFPRNEDADAAFATAVPKALKGPVPELFAHVATCTEEKASETPYDRVAARTGGAVYTVCDGTLKPPVASIAESFKTSVRTTFALSRDADEVRWVAVDGVKLEASAYEISGRSLKIKASSITSDAERVTVDYE